MGKCIICGTSTDGPICDTHQEDAVFEFRGDSPDQLTSGRFYRGTVDGYADFGVFVDLAPNVTGLLHRSKIDKRLESLDWEPGDSVYVQVNNVRDNGDIDLGWSIRQQPRDFRGTLIQDAEGDHLPDEDDTDDSDGNGGGRAEKTTAATSSAAAITETEANTQSESQESTPDGSSADADADKTADADAQTTTVDETDTTATTDETDTTANEAETTTEERDYARILVDDLRNSVGDDARLEGEVVSVRQTSGPTVFELRDESGVVDCAAFEEAGVRAYPDVETGDIVRLDGEIRVRRDELQVETEDLVVLTDDEKETVERRMEEALESEASPDDFEPLADDDVVEAVIDDTTDAATAIRRAVLESRPVVVRHSATADGYVSGAAIERAVLPLVREEHASNDATYHYFDRRPLEGGVYDMDDATKDVTRMLDNRERHDEKIPLFVFAAAGSTADSLDGLDLLDVYGADTVVVDGITVDDDVRDATVAAVSADGDRSTGTLAANIAAGVNDGVREDLYHLPAVTYWEETPESYVALADEVGIDETAATQLREAIALEAYYQSYEDKRELIIDLLFDQEVGLAEQISEQFSEKLTAELDTAEANIETREVDGTSFSVLDTDAYTHRFDFPPKDLLLDELHRRHRDETPVVVGYSTDELYVRSDADLDLRSIAEDSSQRAPNAGLSARGSRTGKLVFLSGRRDDVVDAVLEAVAESR